MATQILIPDESKKLYIERRKKDLIICRQALETLDFERLIGLGHQIKGNAATFGYPDLSLIAIELEALAIKKDIQKLTLVIDQFETFLSQT